MCIILEILKRMSCSTILLGLHLPSYFLCIIITNNWYILIKIWMTFMWEKLYPLNPSINKRHNSGIIDTGKNNLIKYNQEMSLICHLIIFSWNFRNLLLLQIYHHQNELILYIKSDKNTSFVNSLWFRRICI